MRNVLKKYEFDKVRLEAIFQKGQTQKKHHISYVYHHSHTPPQVQHIHHATHAHHAHTNAFAYHANTHHAYLYAKVYTCTYWDRKGHMAKYCYDRLNASNSHVWVRKTNILGPKKVWVPKSTLILNDIGTH